MLLLSQQDRKKVSQKIHSLPTCLNLTYEKSEGEIQAIYYSTNPITCIVMPFSKNLYYRL